MSFWFQENEVLIGKSEKNISGTLYLEFRCMR
jgi:hypothetical protein